MLLLLLLEIDIHVTKNSGTCKRKNYYFWFLIPLTPPFKGIALNYFDGNVGPCP